MNKKVPSLIQTEEKKFSYFYPQRSDLPRLNSGDNENTFPSVKNI